MIDVTHSCTGNPWLGSSAMTATEYEGGFLLPQLMGAVASESIAAPITHRFSTHQSTASVLKLCIPLLLALKLSFPPL